MEPWGRSRPGKGSRCPPSTVLALQWAQPLALLGQLLLPAALGMLSCWQGPAQPRRPPRLSARSNGRGSHLLLSRRFAGQLGIAGTWSGQSLQSSALVPASTRNGGRAVGVLGLPLATRDRAPPAASSAPWPSAEPGIAAGTACAVPIRGPGDSGVRWVLGPCSPCGSRGCSVQVSHGQCHRGLCPVVVPVRLGSAVGSGGVPGHLVPPGGWCSKGARAAVACWPCSDRSITFDLHLPNEL